MKKSVIPWCGILAFALVLVCPGFSPAQFRSKNPLARSEQRSRQERYMSTVQDTQWIRSYGTTRNDYLYTIKQTRDGGYLAGGMTYEGGHGGTDAVLIKFTSDGSIDWQKSYGGERADGFWNTSFIEASDGGFILATDTESYGAGKRDIWVMKLSPNGNIIWQKTYGREELDDDSAGGIQKTRDGGYIITGSAGSTEHTEEILVLKLDAAGNILWDKIFGGAFGQWGDSILQTSDGGYILGAGVYALPGLARGAHPAILKLDSNGNIEWQKVYEGYGRNWPFHTIVKATRDGGYVVSDYVDPAWDGNEDFWVFKLNSVGNIQWQNLYGGSGWDRIGRALCQTRDGGYAVAGYTNSYGRGSFDGWILKLNPSGNIVWQKTYGDSLSEIFFSLDQKSNGEFIAAGYSSRGSDEMLVMKVTEAGEIGGGSDWVLNSTAVATPTFTVPKNINLYSKAAGLISGFSNSSPANLSLIQGLLTWNLHQPPINTSVRTEMNRSLFVKEYYNILSWQPNPQNDQFSVVEYKIYRKVSGGQYGLVDSVPADTYEYMDLISATGEVLEYALTSVDSEGRESPKSIPAKTS